MLSLHPVSERDVVALRRFETDNRAFFESHINARPPAYYDAGGIEAAVATALREAAADIGHQYLIRDADGDVIGACGISGDTADNDEICAIAGIEAAGLKADPGGSKK